MNSRLQASLPSPVIAERACPVCHGGPAETLHRQRYALFDDSDLPGATTIVACAACGMAYAASTAVAADYRQHYVRHSKYDTAVQVSGSGATPADRQRLDELVRFLSTHVASLAHHDTTILDIGAGRGGLLAAFVAQGYDRVVGIDPSPGCVAAMRASGLQAAVGELEHVEWPTDPRCFDLVVLSHVLEHVFDVADAFGRVARRVAPGGAIYIEVPDAARYTTEGFPPFYFFDPEHINHFDAAALGRLAHSQGWEVAALWPRSLTLDNHLRYPAVGVVLQRATDGSQTVQIDAPHDASSLVHYIETSRRAVARSIDGPVLARLVAAATPVVVWGAGSHAQRLLAQTDLARCSIACIIDSDPGKQRRSLAGHRVVTADAGLACAEERGATVCVAIAVGADRVIETIERMRPAIPIVRL